MGLETGTYINSLNPLWPLGGTDEAKFGDDHLRIIKSTIANTWPNVNGAVNPTPAEFNTLVGAAALILDKASPGTIGGTIPGVGAFSSITLTTPLAIADGGTAGATASAARTNLGAEAANSDILKANVTDVLTKGFATTAVALSGTSVTPGLTLANVFTWPITGNSTLNNPTVTGAGVWYIYATVNATGGYTMSFGANFNTISGTFDGTANAVNRFTITSDGTAFDLNIDQRA